MAETFNWAQSHGATPTVVDLGETGNLFNFKDIDDATAANYSTNQITASDTADEGRSYEVWLRAHFTGTFNTIDNIQFWKSTDFSPSTGLSVYAAMNNVTWAQAIKTDSTIATSLVPTADPGTANVSIGGSLSGSLTAVGYSDYIDLQADVALTAPSGDSSLAEFSLQYDVS